MHTLKIETLSVKQLTTPHDEQAVAMTTVTAKQARELVDDNNHHLMPNRTISQATVEAYRRDMIGGRWRGDNGASLAFNPEGKLIDGEHRIRGLARITDDDYGVTFFVHFGVPDEARDTMDDGRKRTAADKFNLSHKAGKLGIKLSAALRSLAIMGTGQGSGGRMSSTALIQLNEQHPHMLACVKKIMDVDRDDQVPVRPAVVTALYYAAKHLLKEPDKADAMLSVMMSGDKSYDGDPMHAWREYVIKQPKRLSEAEAIRGTVKAWNLFVKGEKFTGRWSIPNSQPLVDGLGIAKVFGDMVEGYLANAPKAPAKAPTEPAAAPKPEAAPKAADKPAKAPAKASKKGDSGNKGHKVKNGSEPVPAAAVVPVVDADGNPIIGQELWNDADRAEEADKLAARAKGNKQEAAPADAAH